MADAEAMDVEEAQPAASDAPKEADSSKAPTKRFEIKKWNAVAMWSWAICTDTCAICRNNLYEPSIEYQANPTGAHQLRVCLLRRPSGEQPSLCRSCRAVATLRQEDPFLLSMRTAAQAVVNLNCWERCGHLAGPSTLPGWVATGVIIFSVPVHHLHMSPGVGCARPPTGATVPCLNASRLLKRCRKTRRWATKESAGSRQLVACPTHATSAFQGAARWEAAQAPIASNTT